MYLSKLEKEKIFTILEKFNFAQEETLQLIQAIENSIDGNYTRFIQVLKYKMYFNQKIGYLNNVLHAVLEIFFLLSTGEEQKNRQKELQSSLLFLFEHIFIKRFIYAEKLERRSGATQKILEYTSQRLNQLLETQELMIANISHEMRTSLHTISGYLRLIDEKGFLEGAEKEYIKKCNDASITLTSHLTDILDISRINSAQMETKMEKFWLDEMLLTAINHISLALSKSTLSFDVMSDLFHEELVGDPQHIMQILINFLSNALKYTEKGSIVLKVKKLKTLDERVEICFEVSDTGIGMTEKDLNAIFDPYSRFQKDKPGIGLGMHIALNLAKQLDAKIDIKSEVQKGSTFSLSLTLKSVKTEIISLEDKIFCFLDTRNNNYLHKERYQFLRKLGASILLFNKEKDFRDYLLNIEDNIPHSISIITQPTEYVKYNALIHYLKLSNKFEKTSFIAEETHQEIVLNHFQHSYSYFAPISHYISTVKTHNKIKKKKSILKKEHIKILAIDDKETNLEILKLFILNKYPHVLLDLALCGYKALALYEKKDYDLILLDLQMPDLNGFEVLDAFQKLKKPPLVYALTADVYKTTYDKVLETGFEGLIEKPLNPNHLFEIIEKVMNASLHS
jgi:signal transduction histidine kinase/CheY-like chemotaxis protein